MNASDSTPQMNYLALGDSYTIGESVEGKESFPSQTVHILNKNGYRFSSPNIIAKTGWTTYELESAIDAADLKEKFSVVSLLIGVNNQYRGRSRDEYSYQFEMLLKKSIEFANGIPAHVFVLSIPDWGQTPFAKGRDRSKIGAEIDAFNAINKKVCAKYEVNYIDITELNRGDSMKIEFLAPDGLHPSAKEYSKWAEELAASIEKVIK